MANNLYTSYANSLLNSEVHPDLDTDNIKAVITDHTDDTPVLATDDNLDDIAAGTVATSSNMTGPAVSGGAIDYADFAFSTVSGDAADSMSFYMDSGVAGTSTLICYFDTATGLPVTPNGADINVALNGSGLFKIVV